MKVNLVSAILLSSGVILVSASSADTGTPGVAPRPKSPYARARLTESANAYYRTFWGVEILGVKRVSSGALVRFSYKVLDATRAVQLNDKTADPFLYDQKTRAKLVIPQMEKIGKLRQSSTPENGREYWMLFSNKGNLVKPGSRVDVVIGGFRAQGLTVQAD